jgi:two-component system sensor kinase FixL
LTEINIKYSTPDKIILRMFENFSEGILVVSDGLVCFANSSFVRIFNLPTANVLNTPLRSVLEQLFVTANTIAILTDPLGADGVDSDLMSCRGSKQNRVFRVRRFWVDTGLIASKSWSGSGLDTLMFVDGPAWQESQHSTELLVEQLVRADRVAALGEISMALAHEINQPLSAIINFAGAARRTIKGRIVRADEVDAALHNITSEATRAADVIKSLRTFLRGNPQPTGPANINYAVKEVLDFAGPMIRQLSINLRLDLVPEVPPIQADQIILQQILLNLVTNAIQAVQDVALYRRNLTISTSVELNNRVAISISDTGVGVPENIGMRIFEPLMTTKTEGSGLGLAIVQTLTQRLGGTIEMQSEKNNGACFTIYLPILNYNKFTNV